MEDFVSFEIAKKLKEKGFRKPCILYYNSDKVRTWFNEPDIAKNFVPTTLGNDDVLAPTISQVLKWLREKHATHIEISLGRNGWYFEIIQYEYYEEEKEYGCKLITISVINDSYEDSALAGIEYSLDNLI